MSLLQNEQEPVLYPWFHGYSPFLLGVKPLQARALGVSPVVVVAENNPVNSKPFLWIGVAVFALILVVLLLAVV